MKDKLHQSLKRRVEEEMRVQVDEVLLERLRGYATEGMLYWEQPSEENKTLNQFFGELKGLLFDEMLRGQYGSAILVDSIIVISFEVGRRMGSERQQKDADAQAPVLGGK